jgi:hypothetical protein
MGGEERLVVLGGYSEDVDQDGQRGERRLGIESL